MKKSWLLISLYLFILFGSITWSAQYYPFTPTFPYYQLTESYPRLWSTLSHFDGVNYLRLATNGYPTGGGEVAFFPLFPLLIRGFINLGIDPFLAALLLNGILFILLILFAKTLYPQIFTKFSWLFLSFPASFFLLATYSEALFLVLFLTFTACLHKRWFYLAAGVAGLASSTRLVGSILGVILLIEYFYSHPLTINYKPLTLFILSQLGLIFYMLYLFQTTGDPLAFIHVQPQFGMGRSGGEIVLLPQVLYRYARMLLTVDIQSYLYWRVVWELITFLGASFALYWYWFKLSISDRIYSTWVIFLPTLSGTLSSYPRYALIALPLFLIIAKSLRPIPLILVVFSQTLILIYNVLLFTRGLFVA